MGNGKVVNKRRFMASYRFEVFDTLMRMKHDTMVDASKLIDKAVEEYLIKNGYEIRLNTEEEHLAIFGKEKGSK